MAIHLNRLINRSTSIVKYAINKNLWIPNRTPITPSDFLRESALFNQKLADMLREMPAMKDAVLPDPRQLRNGAGGGSPGGGSPQAAGAGGGSRTPQTPGAGGGSRSPQTAGAGTGAGGGSPSPQLAGAESGSPSPQQAGAESGSPSPQQAGAESGSGSPQTAGAGGRSPSPLHAWSSILGMVKKLLYRSSEIRVHGETILSDGSPQITNVKVTAVFEKFRSVLRAKIIHGRFFASCNPITGNEEWTLEIDPKIVKTRHSAETSRVSWDAIVVFLHGLPQKLYTFLLGKGRKRNIGIGTKHDLVDGHVEVTPVITEKEDTPTADGGGSGIGSADDGGGSGIGSAAANYGGSTTDGVGDSTNSPATTDVGSKVDANSPPIDIGFEIGDSTDGVARVGDSTNSPASDDGGDGVSKK